MAAVPTATQVGPVASPPPSLPKILSLGEYKVAVNEIPGPTNDNVTAFDNLQVQTVVVTSWLSCHVVGVVKLCLLEIQDKMDEMFEV